MASRNEWDDLRARANADPLFMSWLWQSTWWGHFGSHNRLHLHIIAVRNNRNRLVAIAPFCKRKHKVHGVSTTRLETLGNLWQGPQTMRSEYMEPLIDPDWLEPATSAIAELLFKMGSVDELLLPDCPVTSQSSNLLFAKLKSRWFVRKIVRIGEDETRYSKLPNGFDDYLANLGPNTRRRFYGRRKLAAQIGEVAIELADISTITSYFDDLNSFHIERWGQPVFEGTRLAFHIELAVELLDLGHLRLTRLTIAGNTISILYNIIAGDREYNFQMGFDQDFLKGKLSPGLLHLGYALEKAMMENRAEFDLLAGAGKNELYKLRITDSGVQLCTWHAVRPLWRQAVYKIREIIASSGERRNP